MNRKGYLRDLPWASLGRLETPDEFRSRWDLQVSQLSLLKVRPFFSLLMKPLPTSPENAAQGLEALKQQSYPHFEIVNLSESCRGDWVGIIDSGDVLSPVALFILARAIERSPNVDVFYTDELIFPNTRGALSFFSKGAFSEFNFRHFNCVGRFWVARSSLIDKIGGFNPKSGDNFEYDALLRLFENKAKFCHLPWFLYYRRKAITPKAKSSWTPPLPATESLPLISVLIPFRNQARMTEGCIRSVLESRGKFPVELCVIDNRSEALETEAIRQCLESAKGVNARLLSFDKPFNYAHLHNEIIHQEAKGSLLFFLNNDVCLRTSGSQSPIDEMAAWALQPWVGTVGIRLLYPDGSLQHGGFVARFGGKNRLVRLGNLTQESVLSRLNHEVFGVSFAACMVKREVFLRVGGLRELDFPNGFSDTAFNFECLRHGLKNIYLGSLEGMHYESASRVRAYEYWEECALEREYPDILEKMLREDIGYDHVPDESVSLRAFLSGWVNSRARYLKPYLKRAEYFTLKRWKP